MDSTGAVRLRTATFADAEAIAQLHKRNGMGDLDPVAWRNQWEAYPFAAEFRNIAIGWILETDTGRAVGYLGNVHMLYDLGGRAVKGAIAAAWMVDAGHRNMSLRLLTAFYKQDDVDLFLNVSANPTTARLLTAMKVPRIPIPGYDVPCFWAARPQAFAEAALRKRGIPGASVLARPAGIVLTARDVLLRSGRGHVAAAVSRLSGFDGRFDSFWLSLRAGPPRLRAVRTRAVLEWRFGAQLRGGRAAVVAASQGGTLSGYAVLVRRQSPELGMDAYDVADLQAIQDNPTTIRDLLLASVSIAREDGMDAVKFLTGTPAKRAPADELRPYTYRLGHWQLYYKVESAELKNVLSMADAWDVSLFDTY